MRSIMYQEHSHKKNFRMGFFKSLGKNKNGEEMWQASITK